MGDTAPQDPIILEPGEPKWTYRYGPKPFAGDLFAHTICCARPIYTTSAKLPPYDRLPLVTDCCDKPLVPKPVELPPYSGEHATCRKCGSKAVETKFTTQAQRPYGIPRGGYPAEWLHRRCVVCGAESDEATITHPEDTYASYGLYRPGERELRPIGRPYMGTAAATVDDALDTLLAGLRLPLPAGTELVSRRTVGGPWTLIGTVDEHGGWVMADG